MFTKKLLARLTFTSDFDGKIKTLVRSTELAIISNLGSVSFLFSFFMLSRYMTILNLLTIGLFWSIYFSICCIAFLEIYIWNLCFFIMYCYHSKFLLRDINIKIIKFMSEHHNKVYFNAILQSLLVNIDIVNNKISTYNNMWTKFIFLNWTLLAYIFSIMFVPVLFSKVDNMGLKLFFYLSMSLFGFYISLIAIFCSKGHTESRITYRLLTRLSANKTVKTSIGQQM